MSHQVYYICTEAIILVSNLYERYILTCSNIYEHIMVLFSLAHDHAYAQKTRVPVTVHEDWHFRSVSSINNRNISPIISPIMSFWSKKRGWELVYHIPSIYHHLPVVKPLFFHQPMGIWDIYVATLINITPIIHGLCILIYDIYIYILI